jgi:hypothetical protein
MSALLKFPLTLVLSLGGERKEPGDILRSAQDDKGI